MSARWLGAKAPPSQTEDGAPGTSKPTAGAELSMRNRLNLFGYLHGGLVGVPITERNFIAQR
jgi:hypothetical protein